MLGRRPPIVQTTRSRSARTSTIDTPAARGICAASRSNSARTAAAGGRGRVPARRPAAGAAGGPADMISPMLHAARRGSLTGERYYGRIEGGLADRNERGWITVVFDTPPHENDSRNACGAAGVGANPGRIWLTWIHAAGRPLGCGIRQLSDPYAHTRDRTREGLSTRARRAGDNEFGRRKLQRKRKLPDRLYRPRAIPRAPCLPHRRRMA